MPGFDFAGTRDSGDRSARLGKGRRESPRLFRRGRRPRRPEAFPWGKVAAERPDEGRAAVKTLISLAAARQLPPGEAMSGRGVPIPGRDSADSGGDAFTLQRLMGHSTLNMTKHYCSIYDADIAKNYDRVSPLAQIQKPRETIKM